MQQAIPKLETRRPLFQRFFLQLGWIRFPFGFARCSGTRHSLRCFPGVLCVCFFQKGIYKGIFYFFVCTHNGILYLQAYQSLICTHSFSHLICAFLCAYAVTPVPKITGFP